MAARLGCGLFGSRPAGCVLVAADLRVEEDVALSPIVEARGRRFGFIFITSSCRLATRNRLATRLLRLRGCWASPGLVVVGEDVVVSPFSHGGSGSHSPASFCLLGAQCPYLRPTSATSLFSSRFTSSSTSTVMASSCSAAAPVSPPESGGPGGGFERSRLHPLQSPLLAGFPSNRLFMVLVISIKSCR